MRMLLTSGLIAAAVLGAPALAESQAVGAWETVAETPQGNFESTMTIAENGDGYDVTFEDAPMAGAPAGGPAPASTISDVVVEDASFSFKRSINSPQGALELTYEGTIDGDSITGTATSSFGAIPFTGTRK